MLYTIYRYMMQCDDKRASVTRVLNHGRVQLPDRHPAFGYCRTDDSGRMWLCRSRPEYEGTKIRTYIYDVFDGEGTWLGTQSLPWHISEIQKIQSEYLYRWDPGG